MAASHGPGAPEAAELFAALGDPTRLALITRLGDGGERSIATLSATTQLTRQAVTKHLRVLERAGMVNRARKGRETRFALQRQAIQAARSELDAIAAQWDDALDRLRRFVER